MPDGADWEEKQWTLAGIDWAMSIVYGADGKAAFLHVREAAQGLEAGHLYLLQSLHSHSGLKRKVRRLRGHRRIRRKRGAIRSGRCSSLSVEGHDCIRIRPRRDS
jgi:hypothetical protein